MFMINDKLLKDLIITKVYTIASNITIAANSNYGSGTQQYNLSYPTGYIPVTCTWQNTFDGRVVLWYCNVDANNKYIRWRARNVSSSQVSGISIQVRVLYVKSNLYAGNQEV